MSRVLILGGMGMLGHQLARILQDRHDVTVTVREASDVLPPDYPDVACIGNLDLRDTRAVETLLRSGRWDVVVNAAGAIKHRATPEHAAEAVAINALLPRTLATLARSGPRLVHFSTDCVFSGNQTSARGPAGYRAEDPTDARDLYGLSKLLGEPHAPNCLCIRTSLIGPELRGHHGLLDWYLHHAASDTVSGYTRALFSGLTTPVAARLVDFVIRDAPALTGIWHVAAEPLSKYDLLGKVRETFRRGAALTPHDAFYCDRRLDGSAFRARTGWHAPDWNTMLAELATLDWR